MHGGQVYYAGITACLKIRRVQELRLSYKAKRGALLENMVDVLWLSLCKSSSNFLAGGLAMAAKATAESMETEGRYAVV